MRTRALTIALALLALGATPAVADPAPEFFNLPTGYSASTGIATAPDGTVWLSTGRTFGPAELGRLIPAQAAPGTANGIATFPTPQLSPSTLHLSRSVAYDALDNRVWFVQSDGLVGWADPQLVSPGTSNGMRATVIARAVRNSADPYLSDLWDIAVDGRGLAWFSESSSYSVEPYPGGRIASIDPSLGVTELSNIALQGGASTLSSLRYDAKPEGIAIDASGRPWFAESDAGNPGYRIATPRGSDYDEYQITPCAPFAPCSGSYTGTGPSDVAVAHDGSIWFTNQLRNEVGRLDLAAFTITSYSLPRIDAGLANGQARAIATAPDGTLWVVETGSFSSPNANAIVKLVPGPPAQPDPAASVFHLGAGKYPLAVAPDTHGNVWFSVATDSTPGLVGRLAGVVGTAGGGGGGGQSGGGTVARPASVGVARVGSPSTDGSALSVDQICVGPPDDRCSLVYILSAHEYVTGFPHSRAASAVAAAARHRRRAARARAVILGQTSITLRGGQRKRVTVRLNATGRRLLRRAGRLHVFFTVTQRTASGGAKRIKAVRVTFKQLRARARRRR